MTLKSNHKLEIIKIAMGVIISVVAALWTYTTYTQNERNNELETLIELGNAIAGMHVTCKSEFGNLADLAGESKDSRKGQCYRYFQDSYRISLAAVITVKKPLYSSTKEWMGYWNGLQNVIAAAGSEKYKFNNIESAWVEILVEKGLKEDATEN